MNGANPNAPEATNGAIKDPAEWTTGDEPMTGAQESYVHTLARQAGAEDELPEAMTKAEASEKIDELRHATGKDVVPTKSVAEAKPKRAKASAARPRKRST